MTLYEIASIALIGIATVVVVITIRADHERRKKQSTMETAVQMLREARQILQQEFGIVEITEKEMDRLKNDKILLAKINYAFGVFEHIAVAVKAGVYDKDLIFRTLGQTFVDIYKQYHLYVDFRKEKYGEFTYCEIEDIGTIYTEEIEKGIRKDGVIRWS